MCGKTNLKERHRETARLSIRRLLAFVLPVFLTVLVLCAGAVKAAPQLLVDEADNLTPDEERVLTERLSEVSDRYDADVVLVIIDSLNGADAQAYADDFYDYNGYYENGVLFLLSVNDSEYAFSTLGTVAYDLTDAAIDMIEEDVLSGLRRGKDTRDYYDAYVAYIEGVDKYLGIASSGEPFEYDTPGAGEEEPLHGFAAFKNHLGGNVILSSIAGIAGSFAYMGTQKRKLKSVRRQRGAANYVTGNGPVLTVSDDRFINRSVNKTPIPRREPSSNARSGSGRGTTFHTSSSGRSHGGRSGKF